MKTDICKKLGIEYPIFAFTHCRDVVVAVSKAGGIGVLGAVGYSPDQLKEELDWIDAHIGDYSYGVDTVIPQKYEGMEEKDPEQLLEQLQKMIPDEHRKFVDNLLTESGVPEAPETNGPKGGLLGWTEATAEPQIEEALKHPNVKLIANALGTPPADMIKKIQDKGVLIGALCGKIKQALAHKETPPMSLNPIQNNQITQEEIDRLGNSIIVLKKAFPDILLSLDTYYAAVAQFGINEGCDLINDISAGQFDSELWTVVAQAKIPYILTYNRAEQTNEAKSFVARKGVIADALSFLSEKLEQLKRKGITDVLIDPGFGFGKSLEHNYQLLAQFALFAEHGYPVLAGLSRKSMLGKVTHQEVGDRLIPSIAAAIMAVERGAKIVRTHDVRETVDALKIWQAMREQELTSFIMNND